MPTNTEKIKAGPTGQDGKAACVSLDGQPILKFSDAELLGFDYEYFGPRLRPHEYRRQLEQERRDLEEFRREDLTERAQPWNEASFARLIATLRKHDWLAAAFVIALLSDRSAKQALLEAVAPSLGKAVGAIIDAKIATALAQKGGRGG